jgi:hypothetical protein
MLGILTAIGSAVISAVSSIGPAVASFCSTTLPKIVPVIEKLAPIAEAVAKVAEVVLTVCGIFKPSDKVEEIGDRALQAAEQGVTPDKFDSHQEYMQALRDFPLDPAKSADYSDTAKLCAGIGVGTAGLEQKFNIEPGTLAPLWVLPTLSPQYFTPERVTALLGVTRDVSSVVNYFDGQCSAATARSVETALVKTDQQLDASKSTEQSYGDIDAARQQAQDLARQGA